MTLNAGLMSSETPEWETPAALFKELDSDLGPFNLDVAANAWNAKCPTFFTEDQDGLSQPWTGRVWCNPPYGRTIGKWVEKARDAALSGSAEVVVCLLPARTDTAWWHDFIMTDAAEVRFIRGRVKFGGQGPAPFPSAVVVFRSHWRDVAPVGNLEAGK